jgi:alginate O-acetyltransferase complex protein AlgI
MLFNSYQFFIFFPVVAGIYFFLPQGWRWFWLLVASCYFYMAFVPVYIFILLVTIVIDYWAGIFIEQSKGPVRRFWLVLSIGSTCLVLFVFKYFDFFSANLSTFASFIHWNYSIGALGIILPIGLSFHTFQSLSYVIEVYRGKQKAERHFGIYALYVMFFPQLVAGPIERPQNLLHQFFEKHEFDYDRVTNGLKLMAWGLFKKVVIADRLAILVDQVYNNPHDYSGLPLILATYFFAFQIYCDFSGYSDMAIGSAQVLGFKLMTNFNQPYFSQSIAEFWKRWHISLSTWFRDYLYIPLGGNKVGRMRWLWNLFIVFLISGFWHGANWTFVIWGALNGFYLIFAILTERMRAETAIILKLNRFPRFQQYLRIFITFHLVLLGWIFFRSKSLSDSIYILTHLFPIQWRLFSYQLGLQSNEVFMSCALIIFLLSIHYVQRIFSIRRFLAKQPVFIRWPVYYCSVCLMLLLGYFHKNAFIYFQF